MSEQIEQAMTIWVLTDEAGGDLAKYAGPLEIGVEKLREHMEAFTGTISTAIAGARSLAGEFVLKEITVKVTLSAEKGFVLVAKAGVEGALELKFVHSSSK